MGRMPMKYDIGAVYDRYFETYYAYMLERRKSDPYLTKDFLKGLIESLYVAQGNNWEGRSEVKDAEYRAMISAYEVILGDWEAEG